MVNQLLEIRNLTFGANHQHILNGLDLSIAEQEIHALLGANGSGKSTLAHLMMGCEGYLPQAGQVRFAGQDILSLPIHERARLGLTLAWQEPARFEGISVEQYVILRKPERDSASYLRMVGLAPEAYLHRAVDKSLSGGERKRIELAAVLALHPKLAILDEPTAGIDLLSLRDIMNVIRAFKDVGASVLLITHQEEVAMIADRASQLCGGRIVCSGDPQVVAENYKGRVCVRCNGVECGYG